MAKIQKKQRRSAPLPPRVLPVRYRGEEYRRISEFVDALKSEDPRITISAFVRQSSLEAVAAKEARK